MKKPKKINKPDDCHGCVYYNCYGDYCTRKGLICRFKSLEEEYRKVRKNFTSPNRKGGTYDDRNKCKFKA